MAKPTPAAKEKNESRRSLDPGTLMLLTYVLAILLLVLWGGLSQAQGGASTVELLAARDIPRQQVATDVWGSSAYHPANVHSIVISTGR